MLAYPKGRLAWWIGLLWRWMSQTGRGYRRHSLRNTGRDEDRRADKRAGESAMHRKARLGLLTKRH